MSQYTEQDIAKMRAADKRDEHAHARIDELQKMLTQLLRGQLFSDATLKEMFKEADKRAEKKLGLR